MAKLTTALLQRAASLASQALKVQGELSEAFTERYGATYSDVDCDSLIDILDYGGGHVTLKIADEEMARCGKPPLIGRRAKAEDGR